MLARLSGLEARIAEALRLAEEAANRETGPEMVKVNIHIHACIDTHSPSSHIQSIGLS